MTREGGVRRTSNVLFFFGGELGSRVVAFAATAYLAVTLGPQGFGVVGFALAFYSYLSVLINSGFADVGSRAVAQDLDSSASLGTSVTVIRLLIAGVLFGALYLLAPLIEEDPQARLVLILTCLLLFAAAMDTSWVFRGREEGLRVSISLILRRLIYAILVFVWIRGPEDLVRVPLTQVAGDLVGVVWLGFGLFTVGITGIDLAKGWRTYLAAGPLILAKFMRTSIVTLDVLLLGFMVSDEAVGLYSAPYRICFLVMALAGAIQVAYLADISRSSGRELVMAAKRHMDVSLTLGVPITIGGILLAEPIIIEVFGRDYESAARAFQLLLVSVGVLFAFGPLHNVLLARDRLGLETWFFGVAAVGNAVLNVFWIPRYGILGAAAATVIAECFILILMAIAAGRWLGWTPMRSVAKPLIASIVMVAGLTIVAPGSALLVGIPLGAVIYGVTLVLLGGVPEDVKATLSRFVARMKGT